MQCEKITWVVVVVVVVVLVQEEKEWFEARDFYKKKPGDGSTQHLDTGRKI